MISDYPVTVQYNASISKDDVAITSYSWELVGEGSLGTTPSGSISFEEEGAHLLRLTVVDSDGQAASKDYPVLVRSNPAPVASFTATPETQNLPAKVKFDARTSSDDKNIALYKWNFGSEGYFESSSHLAEFIFQSAGPHEVVLTVVDSQGTEASTQESLSFQTNAAPVAALVADVEEGEIPLAVKFDASTTTDDEAGIEYSWNFGEGPVIGGSKISYTFKEAGSFEVTVTATDRQGLSSQASVTIDTTDATQTDTQAPTILAGPESGPIAENQNEVVLALNDDTAVNYESLRIYWNNALLPPERITVDAPNNIVRVSTGTITQGESFTLGVKVTDNAGNLASKGFYYQVLTPVPADTFGPIVNFIPQGGDLTTLTPQITVALYDPAGVDFSQIQAYLNGDLIPGARITTDSANSRFIITLDQDLSLTANEINTIQVSVRDTIGNVSLAGVGFDTRTEKTTIVEVPGVSQIGLSMGNVHSCHITADRNVKCWGFGTSGYLGYGNTQNLGDNETVDQIPTVEIGGFAEQLALGAGHSCVLLTDGNVRCWGLSDQGQLGNGDNVTIGDNEIPTSRPVVSLGGAAAKIVTGGFHNCILKNSGGLLCWGYNAFGQLGQSTTQNIGDNELPSTFADINVGGTSPVVDVATGNFHTCALTAAGEVKCWGRNNFRQIGSSNTALLIGDNEAPSTQAFLNLGGVATAIAVGAEHSCALLQNKRVKCWGRNDVGQLGIATTVVPLDATSAPLVDVGEDVDKIAAGGNNTCVITVTGKAKCWGVNNTGQLGLGNTLTIGDNEHPSSVPHIELGSLVSFVEPGGNHTCAVTDTSLLYCWGNGSLGRLGYGNTQTIGDNELPITAGPVNINGLGGPQTVIAKVSSNPSSGEIPLTVSFDGTESSSTVGAIQNYHWDFGDGTIVDEATGTPQHTYTQVGVFLVTLTVRDGNNNEATVKTAVSVDADVVPPVARFIADADAHKIGDDFTFDASTSYDPKGSVESYYWNFGDGQVLSTTNPIATHSYQTLGIFLVSLKVYGSDNRVSSETFYPVFVNDINEAPLARLSCTPGNYEVTCTASNSVDYDGFIGAFEWDMGDGTPYTTESVTHSYPVPGNGKYKVKLTVHDNGGSSHTIESQDYIFDTTAPVITSNITSQTITNSRVDYQINVDDENFTTTEIWLNNQKVLTSDDQSLAGRLVLANGTNQVQLRAFDGAGNQATALNYTIQAQNTAPVIQLADPGEVYTNNPSFTVAFDVVDDSSTKASIILNNQIVLQDSTSKNISHPITLAEGTNRIEVVVLDEALQVARQEITGITLDTTAPRLISIKPTNGKRYIGQTQFNVTGEANEPLIAVTIDGDGVTLAPNTATFEYPKTQPAEGEHSYTIVLTDRAGNTTEAVRTYEVLQHILYGQLVTVIPDNGELRVVGMPGATRYPNQEVEISGGFLNSTTVTANADGSFEGRISFTNSIELFAESAELGFSETFRINYAVDTTLSGVVKDNQDNPLPGVTVRITSSGQTAITNEGGVFSIPSPATGDQQVEIDGTTIPETVTLGVKKFSKTNLSLNLGFKDLNVLPRAVYLTPIIVDGTETVVEPGQAVSVTSPHAPGVELDIPANAAIFPAGTEVEINGEMKNVINIAETPAARSSVPVLEEATPDVVYSLEPSGLEFSAPIKLTLPNDNELGVGTRVVIMSKNSKTGVWEIDGAGEVTAGDKIETLPNQGITHFSEVYAVPYGLDVASRSNGELPTIDAQSGALSTAIEMPSFKVMGQDITPALVYKSTWAEPNALVSNVFNLDRTYQIQRVDAGSVGGFGLSSSAQATQEIWSTPESITSQFAVENIESDKITFNVANAPNQAIVSYALDLKNLISGQYFARSTYEVKYKHLIKTTTVVKSSGITGSNREQSVDKQVLYEKIFPEPLGQVIHHQNKSSSEFGAGWKLNFTQNILNPGNPRLLIEESSGATSAYTLDNTIETLAYDEAGIQTASLDSSESVSYVAENGEVKSVDLSDGQSVSNAPVDSLFDIQPYVVDQQVNVAYVKSRSSKKCSGQKVFGECAGHWYYSYSIGCQQNRYDVEPEKNLTAFKKDGNQYFYLDPKGALFKYAGSESLVTGTVGRPNRINLANTKAFPNIANACNSALGESCNSTNMIRSQVWTKSSNQRSSSFTPGLSYCGTPPVATPPALLASNYPLGGSYATGTLTQSKFNNPMDFAVSKTEGGVIYIADTGNNVVRKVFASGNAVIDFAGNRGMSGNETTGDNQVATLATIIHPRGVETDSAGNVYISSENGHIWKVDLNNKLKLLAGKNRTPGPVESSTLDKLNLVRPSGLVLDETKNLLYVADTGNNRVMALDLAEGKANQVAGNFLCQAGPEFILNGSPALDVSICSPEKIGLDENKNLLVLDKANKMVRRINFNFSGSGSAVYKTLAKDGSKIIRNEDGTFKRIYRDLNEIIYNSAGQQIAAKDRLGNTTTFTYSDGKLVTVVDPKGGVSSLTYSGGKLVSFIDPANRETEFVFDGHKLVGVNYPDGTGKSFDYEASTNLMVSETNQRNFTTSYQYGAWKRLAAVVRPDNTNIQVAENISETIGNSYTGGTMGEVKSYGEGNEEGNELSNVYTNAKGIETKLKNDLKGYVSEITDALGRKTTIERDLDGRPTKITRPNLEYTDMTYNERGDLVTRFESASGTTDTYSYSAEGKLISYTTETDGVSRTSSNTYYPNGQLYTERDPNNRIVVRTYLQNGLLYSVENDLGEKSTLGYDTRGNVRTTQTPKGEESLIIRDISGNVIQKTDAKGVTSKYGFDMFNRLIRVETGITGNRPAGDVTQYQYSGTGQLTQITDPQNNVTTIEYNSLDQLIKKTGSLGQITELAYDANGNVTWEKDPNGNIKTFEYSDTDQLLRKVLPDNLYQMAYDDNENLTSISDSDSQIGITYEELNGDYLVKTVSSQGTELPSVTLTNTFDRFGNRTQLQTPYGSFGYTFDAGNLLTNVSNPFGENFAFTFDAANRLKTITRSGSVTTMDFDQNSFMTSIVHKRGATTVTQALYTADAVGNKITKTTPEGVHNYSYDENYQLKTATNPEGGTEFGSEIFNYDSLGNRTNDQLGAYAYDLKKQRLVEDHQNFYSYDNNGNIVTKSRKGMNGTSVNYIYSSDNQLVEVQFFENYLAVKNVFYRYDALGRRTQRTVVHATNPSAPVSRVWVYDGSEMIAEHDGELNHLATYTQSTMRTDDTLAVRVTSAGVSAGLAQASGTYNYLKDTLGSVAAVTDNAGNLVQRYVYSSFGKIISIKDETANDVTANAPLKTAYAYTNREWDEEIGLYYYRLRYYDQNVGRFLSEDPDGGKVANPETFKSRYTYVQNNPIYFIDPTGAVAEVKFSFGGVKFSSSWKSIALYIANPYAAIPKLFLKGKDSDRYDNVVMASYVVAAAFALSPASAAVALSSVVISNIGREDQGNFFDSLDDYSIQFLVTFSISELSGGPDMSGDPVLREIGTNIAARLLFDSIERTYGVGTLNTVKAGLFIAFPGRRIYQNFNSPYPYFVTIPLIERNYR
jgi:RHS repeat-associated protein